MESLYAQCMKERYGRGVIEHPFGYLVYRIEGNQCSAIEIFIHPESRGSGAWKTLWDELRSLCRQRGVTRILGFVDTAMPEPTARLKAYFRHGAQIREVIDKVIIIQWEV